MIEARPDICRTVGIARSTGVRRGAWSVCRRARQAGSGNCASRRLGTGRAGCDAERWRIAFYQKYFELPIAALTVVTMTALEAKGLINRRWSLVGLAAFQAICFLGE